MTCRTDSSYENTRSSAPRSLCTSGKSSIPCLMRILSPHEEDLLPVVHRALASGIYVCIPDRSRYDIWNMTQHPLPEMIFQGIQSMRHWGSIIVQVEEQISPPILRQQTHGGVWAISQGIPLQGVVGRSTAAERVPRCLQQWRLLPCRPYTRDRSNDHMGHEGNMNLQRYLDRQDSRRSFFLVHLLARNLGGRHGV